MKFTPPPAPPPETVTARVKDLVYREHDIDRTGMKKSIQEHWVGKRSSNIGIQYVTLNAGKVELRKNAFERRDIGSIGFDGPDRKHWFNVFIEPDGSHSGPNGSATVEMTKIEQRWLDSIVQAWIDKRPEFVARQRKWFDAQPWKQLDGLTPEQAVAKLEEMGW